MTIRQIEKLRIKQFNLKKKNLIKRILMVAGDNIIIWYINREKEKGGIRFQFNKGICICIRNRGYNTTFILRGLLNGVIIEQQYLYYSINNINMLLKKNIIRYYRSNILKYLRKKKIKKVNL